MPFLDSMRVSNGLFCQMIYLQSQWEHKTHLIFEILFIGDHRLTFYLCVDKVWNVNPSGTKGFGTHTKNKGGWKEPPPQYLKNDKCYKPETFGGVRGILQGLKKLQVDITAFAW